MRLIVRRFSLGLFEFDQKKFWEITYHKEVRSTKALQNRFLQRCRLMGIL